MIAAPSDHDRLSAKLWIVSLFDRGVERVHVHMNDLAKGSRGLSGDYVLGVGCCYRSAMSVPEILARTCLIPDAIKDRQNEGWRKPGQDERMPVPLIAAISMGLAAQGFNPGFPLRLTPSSAPSHLAIPPPKRVTYYCAQLRRMRHSAALNPASSSCFIEEQPNVLPAACTP
jgi:hypothetical protein